MPRAAISASQAPPQADRSGSRPQVTFLTLRNSLPHTLTDVTVITHMVVGELSISANDAACDNTPPLGAEGVMTAMGELKTINPGRQKMGGRYRTN